MGEQSKKDRAADVEAIDVLDRLYRDVDDDDGDDRRAGARDRDGDGDMDEAGAGEWASLRSVLREARAGGFDEEPPPRIDALLMAAARAHAPKPRVPWWSRLAGWMRPVVAHPALAGAAALVIVAGAAGVMYQRGQPMVVHPRIERSAPSPQQQVATSDAVPGRLDPASVTVTLDDPPAPVVAPPPPPAEAAKPSGTGEVVARTTPSRRPADGRGLAREQRPAAGAGAASDDADGLTFQGAVGSSGEGMLAAELRKAEMLELEDDAREAPPVQIATGPAPEETQRSGAPRVDQARDRGEAPGAATAPQAPPPAADSVVITSGSDRSSTDARTQATQLLGQARTAAKARQCGVVKTIGERVRKLDAAYHRDVFVRDADVAKCL